MRFTGDVEAIAEVDVTDLVRWIVGIDFAAWPQQSKLADGLLRPAMVTDPDWFGFKAITDPVVDVVMGSFRGGAAYQRMLSVVMAGHSIEPHRDWQAPDWCCRVHVPLTSNDRSSFVVDGRSHRLDPGVAYRVNTEAEHSVVNNGTTPRVHFMFDLRSVQ